LLERQVLLETAVASNRKQIGLVGAVGIELKATLKTRKLLIPLIAKNAKNIEVAQLRYTPGTRSWESVDIGAVAVRFRRASSRQRRR
jgi:hypothetical protein